MCDRDGAPEATGSWVLHPSASTSLSSSRESLARRQWLRDALRMCTDYTRTEATITSIAVQRQKEMLPTLVHLCAPVGLWWPSAAANLLRATTPANSGAGSMMAPASIPLRSNSLRTPASTFPAFASATLPRGPLGSCTMSAGVIWKSRLSRRVHASSSPLRYSLCDMCAGFVRCRRRMRRRG